MIRLAGLLALLLALWPGRVAAEVAVVRGGEHPDFTRIVVEAAQPGDWRFGRTEDGYELQLGPEVTGYNLTQAFERIPRDRVSALWRDPVSGRLRFSLSCPCFAVAFEFRPGVVVIDLKTGQPPRGSAFEGPLDPPPKPGAAPEAKPDPGPVPAPVAQGPGYDWLAVLRQGDAAPAEGATRPLPLPLQIEDPRIDPLRAALLEQISRGAAEGIVGIAEHPILPKASEDRRSEGPGMRIVTGDLPGMVASGVHDPKPNLTAEGGPCLTDADLDLASWLLPGPVAEQLGPGRAGLLGEFDAPAPDAIRRAARLYIALGFGAEARQYLSLLPAPPPDSTGDALRMLAALSRLADQEPDETGYFAPMAGCNTAAALWSALALQLRGGVEASDIKALNGGAVARSFSALPIHLRRQFGPGLVEMFLSAGRDEEARLIRDAILRAPGEAGPEVALMDAKYDLATGDGQDAAKIAKDVAQKTGPANPEALVTLVEAAFKTGAVLPAGLPETLMAYRGDAGGTAMEAPLRRAFILASALKGDFAAAFAELPQAPDTAADLWSLAVGGAGDDLFLAQAVPLAAKGRPPVAPDVALAGAQRLQDLGFPEAALAWLGPVDTASDPPRRILAARAALALRDARAAGALVSGMDTPDAQAIRAAAVLQLGDATAAAQALDRAGDTAGRDRALAWAQDWPALAKAGSAPWQAAAEMTGVPAAPAAGPGDAPPPAAPPDAPSDAPPDAPAGPLAQGAALVADSAAARAAVEALLTSVAAPASP